MRAASAVAAIAVMLAGCGWTPADEQVLTRFFELSRLYDRTRLASHATVVFDPRTDGVVQRFVVLARSADEPLATERVRRRVTLQTEVRSAAGQVQQRTLVVTLEQQAGRWTVTAFR